MTDDTNGADAQDALLRSHEAEAKERGAEFTNHGCVTDRNVIGSKTTKGRLISGINPKTMEVRHQWWDQPSDHLARFFKTQAAPEWED